MPAGSLRGYVDTKQFRTLAGKSSQLEPKLKRALRKNIRQIAEVAAQDSRQTVLSGPAGSGPQTGLRAGIAAGIKVTLMTGNTAGIIIRATGSGLPASQKKLVRAYNKPGGWRHPVFKTGTWARQQGRPYFGSVIIQHKDQVTRAVELAMYQAAQSLK